MAARMEFALGAVEGFHKLLPSEGDLKAVQETLIRVAGDPHAGQPIPFQWNHCYLTWAGEWRIIYQVRDEDAGEVVYVLNIELEGVEFAKSALESFRKLFPSDDDVKAIRHALRNAACNPGARVPLHLQWKGCYLVCAGRWRIIYQERNPGMCVVHIDKRAQ